MLAFIVQIILVLSLGGLGFMVVRKIPALLVLIDAKPTSTKKEIFFKRTREIKEKVKKNLPRPKALKAKIKKRLKKDRKKEEIDSDGDYWEKIKNGK